MSYNSVKKRQCKDGTSVTHKEGRSFVNIGVSRICCFIYTTFTAGCIKPSDSPNNAETARLVVARAFMNTVSSAS